MSIKDTFEVLSNDKVWMKRYPTYNDYKPVMISTGIRYASIFRGHPLSKSYLDDIPSVIIESFISKIHLINPVNNCKSKCCQYMKQMIEGDLIKFVKDISPIKSLYPNEVRNLDESPQLMNKFKAISEDPFHYEVSDEEKRDTLESLLDSYSHNVSYMEADGDNRFIKSYPSIVKDKFGFNEESKLYTPREIQSQYKVTPDIINRAVGDFSSYVLNDVTLKRTLEDILP